MTSRFILATFLAVVTPSVAVRRLPPTASFHEYLNFFGRTYDHGSEEGQLRQRLFEQRADAVRRQNQKEGALWQAALNSFSDWTPQELLDLRGWRPSAPHGRPKLGLMDTGAGHYRAGLPNNFPESKDWAHLSSIDVSNQASCGSCWAFASAYLLRAHYEIQTNDTKMFAVQEFVNCVSNPNECGGSGGCQGATVELAMGYVKNVTLAKLSVEDDLPYTAADGSCDKPALISKSSGKLRGGDLKNDGQAGVGLLGFRTLTSNRAAPLLTALLDGPVAVSVAAALWFDYFSGVFDACSGEDGWIIDHAVLMTGFGVDSSTKYWKIMNSWGPDWGEGGFMRILRQDVAQDDSHCDWDTRPGDGIACKPYPDKVKTCGMCGILYDSVAVQLGRL